MHFQNIWLPSTAGWPHSAIRLVMRGHRTEHRCLIGHERSPDWTPLPDWSEFAGTWCGCILIGCCGSRDGSIESFSRQMYAWFINNRYLIDSTFRRRCLLDWSWLYCLECFLQGWVFVFILTTRALHVDCLLLHSLNVYLISYTPYANFPAECWGITIRWTKATRNYQAGAC